MEARLSCSNCTIGSCALEMLTWKELKKMESHTHQTRYAKGEILRKQNMPLDSLIYLRTGFVKEYIWHENHADQVIQIVKPRTYIGLQGLCTNTVSLYSYQAITDADICYIEKETFSKLIIGNGNFAREILISLSQESVSNHKRFLSVNKTQTFGKVAGLIIYLSEEVFENRRFNLWLNRTELSQMIASTRESVTRALRWFHNEGIIELDRNTLFIKDEPRLMEIAKRG